MKNQTNDSEAIMFLHRRKSKEQHMVHIIMHLILVIVKLEGTAPLIICNMIKLKMWRVHMNTILVVFEKYKRNGELKNKGINFRKVSFQLS